jgi:hypothetical protein
LARQVGVSKALGYGAGFWRTVDSYRFSRTNKTGYATRVHLLKNKKVEETLLSAGATAAAYTAAATAPASTASDASHSPAAPAWAPMEAAPEGFNLVRGN